MNFVTRLSNGLPQLADHNKRLGVGREPIVRTNLPYCLNQIGIDINRPAVKTGQRNERHALRLRELRSINSLIVIVLLIVPSVCATNIYCGGGTGFASDIHGRDIQA